MRELAICRLKARSQGQGLRLQARYCRGRFRVQYSYAEGVSLSIPQDRACRKLAFLYEVGLSQLGSLSRPQLPSELATQLLYSMMGHPCHIGVGRESTEFPPPFKHYDGRGTYDPIKRCGMMRLKRGRGVDPHGRPVGHSNPSFAVQKARLSCAVDPAMKAQYTT